MEYYEQDSNPLEEDFPISGERSYDKFGNYIEINAFGTATILKQSVLNADIEITSIESSRGLDMFWRLSKKAREGYEVQDQAE